MALGPAAESEPARLPHLDPSGRARMVDVGDKPDTSRVAVAQGAIKMSPETLRLIVEGKASKGDVLAVAQVAAVQAAKRAWELIPLCHPVPLTGVEVAFEPDEGLPGLRVTARVRSLGKTGVEMEALTAVSVALLTVYDMAKAHDRGMELQGICLLEKRGGQSGTWTRPRTDRQ